MELLNTHAHTYGIHTHRHTHKKENRKGGKKEKKKREGDGVLMGVRAAWVLRRAGPHTNNARST